MTDLPGPAKKSKKVKSSSAQDLEVFLVGLSSLISNIVFYNLDYLQHSSQQSQKSKGSKINKRKHDSPAKSGTIKKKRKDKETETYNPATKTIKATVIILGVVDRSSAAKEIVVVPNTTTLLPLLLPQWPTKPLSTFL